MAPRRRKSRGVEQGDGVGEKRGADRTIGIGYKSATDIPADGIWTLYNEKAGKYDEMLAARLKGSMSMDSVVIFAGLFSAVVTAFIIESYKTLSADSGDLTVFYLAQISQQLGGNSTVAAALVPPPPPFVAPRVSVAVNILWILSLIFSLACALGSTLIQSWTNRYMRKVSSFPDEVRRARERAKFYDGIHKSGMRALADGVPALLHIALFLFLAGLVVFLFPINHDVAWAAMAASAAFSVIYLLIACLHLTIPSWSYHTPLSRAIAICCVIAVGPAISAIIWVSLWALVIIAVMVALLAFPCYTVVNRMSGYSIDFKGIVQRWRETVVTEQELRDSPPNQAIVRVERGPEDVEQDWKVLDFLLEQSHSVSELESILEGIESFIDRDSSEGFGAQAVLELGNASVGPFMTGLGDFTRTLLHSCTSYNSGGMSLTQRRARSVACTRAIIAIFSKTLSEDRTADTFPPAACMFMFSWVPRTQKMFENDIPIWWREWVTEGILNDLASLSLDRDPILALHAICSSVVLIHRSLVDIAYRMDHGEVVIHMPPPWSIRELLQASKGVEKHELFELSVAGKLMNNYVAFGTTTTRYFSRSSITYGTPPGRWTWRARPIAITFNPDPDEEEPEEPRLTNEDGQEKYGILASSKLRGDATLLALSTLLERSWTMTAPRPTRSHIDLLLRTMRALTKDEGAEDASEDTQRAFLVLLKWIYGPEQWSKATWTADEDETSLLPGQDTEGEPLLPILDQDGPTPPNVSAEQRPVHILYRPGVMELILEVVEGKLDRTVHSAMISEVTELLLPRDGVDLR